MLVIRQKHIILGLPIRLSWEIKSRYRFCLMFFPMSSWMIWRNWRLVATKGERSIETHNENFLRSQKQVKIKLYKFRVNGLFLVESLEAPLNDHYSEIDIQSIQPREFQFQLEPMKFSRKSNIKINTADFKIKPISFEIQAKVKSLTFKGLNSEI